jgi:hypothetical protein
MQQPCRHKLITVILMLPFLPSFSCSSRFMLHAHTHIPRTEVHRRPISLMASVYTTYPKGKRESSIDQLLWLQNAAPWYDFQR